MPSMDTNTAQVLVITAGTAVQLSTKAKDIAKVWIQALASNTNKVAIGDANVVAAVGSTQCGIILTNAYAAPIILENISLDQIYVDSITDGEGITIFWTETAKSY